MTSPISNSLSACQKYKSKFKIQKNKSKIKIRISATDNKNKISATELADNICVISFQCMICGWKGKGNCYKTNVKIATNNGTLTYISFWYI